jgi:hypothetical protein
LLGKEAEVVVVGGYYTLSASPSPAAFDGVKTPELDWREANALLRGELRLPGALRVDQVAGRRAGDFVWMSTGPIVSERVRRQLVDAGLTGWSAYAVEVYDREGARLPGYSGLSITGRCASILSDTRDSALVYESGVRGDLPYYIGLIIEFGDCAPSDFFMAADGQTRWICMSKTARDVLVRMKATGVRIRHVSEVRAPAADRPVRYKIV